jgi:uncharacterized protein YwbE
MLARRRELGRVTATARANVETSSGIYDERDWAQPNLNVGSVGTASSLGAGSLGRLNLFSREQTEATETRLGGIQQNRMRSAFEEQAARQQNNRGLAGYYDRISTAASELGKTNDPEQREQIEKRIGAARDQILNKAREEQRISMQGAHERLASAKEEYEIKKQMADEAKRSVQSDITKFVLASPEERERIRSISQKQKKGGKLTRGEIQEAQGYDSFRQFADQQAQRIGLQEMHAGDVFSQSIDEKNRLARDAETAKGAAQKAEMVVEQKHRVDIVLKSDQALSQAVLSAFTPILQEMDKKQADFDEKVKKIVEKTVADTENRKRPTGQGGGWSTPFGF